MSISIIVESGSTKTDWLVLKRGKVIEQFKTEGINPYLQDCSAILKMLEAQVKPIQHVEAIYYYGAGIAQNQQKKTVKTALSRFFATKNIEIESDILAAARALSGDKAAMICILGTGSNACFYDGKKIKAQLPSLGYIAGDEGSGNHLGKKILQYYAYNTFDTTLKEAFEANYKTSLQEIIQHLYQQPFPNRYLASFVPLLAAHRGHYMVENIIEDCFLDFFHTHLFKHRQIWSHPICFTGSVAYLFQDVLKNICSQNELELGTILKSPLEGLKQYHLR